jgi:hypothetical protein
MLTHTVRRPHAPIAVMIGCALIGKCAHSDGGHNRDQPLWRRVTR